MDVMPMATMPVAISRPSGPTARPTAKAAGAASGGASADGFGAALTEAEGGAAVEGASPAKTPRAGQASAPAGPGGGASPVPEGSTDAPQDATSTGLAGALGLSGLVVARALPTGLSGALSGHRGGLTDLAGAMPGGLPAAVALTGLTGPLTPAQRGLQAGLAAQGFLTLEEALRGPEAAGAGGNDLLSQLAAGERQDDLTQELAHLLSARTGPLPDFGPAESGAPPPGAAPPESPAQTPRATLEPVPMAGEGMRSSSDEGSDSPSTDESPAVAAARNAERLAAGPEGERPVEGLAGALAGGSEGAPGGSTVPGGGPLTPTVSAPTAAPATPAPMSTYASSTPTLPPGVEAPAVLRQIGDGLRLLTQGNRQTAEIRLDPVELGKVRVRMEIEGKDVRMYVTTENAAVRDVVAAGLDGLRRDMMAQGLQVQHVSVDVQADARGFGQHRHDDRPEGDAATGERIGDEGALPVGSPGRTRAPRDGKRIDLTA